MQDEKLIDNELDAKNDKDIKELDTVYSEDPVKDLRVKVGAGDYREAKIEQRELRRAIREAKREERKANWLIW